MFLYLSPVAAITLAAATELKKNIPLKIGFLISLQVVFMGAAIGVDIGGTGIRAALVSPNGSIIKETAVISGSEKGENAFLENIKHSIGRVFSGDVTGIGVGCPGPLDCRKGVILNPPNIPLRNFRLRESLEKEFGIPVCIENDGNCFALGEAVFGRARKHRNVVGLTLGTGLGGGIVIDKEIFHGAGNAGEFWFSTINLDGARGKTNNPGAVEEYVSRRGIMRLAAGLGVSEPLGVYRLAMKGNKNAARVFEKFGRYLGIFMVNIICLLDPDAIVIGGGISKSRRFFLKSLRKELERAPFNNAKIYFSEDAGKSAILGAASLLMGRHLPGEREAGKRTKKPWGSFATYAMNKKCTVKVLTVNKNQSLSLQSHRNRDELWIALDDGLKVEVNGRIILPEKGEGTTIPRGSKHRLSTARERARMLEISFGEFDEDDIIRYEDRYGRVD